MNQNQDQFQEVRFQPPPAVKNAAYFRARAREALKNCYWWALLAAFLASLLGGISGGGVSFSSSSSTNVEGAVSIEELVNQYSAAGGLVGIFSDLMPFLTVFAIVGIVAFVFALAFSLFISSPVRVGYQRYNLDVIDGNGKQIVSVFSSFKQGYKKSVLLSLLYGLILFAINLPFTILSIFLFWLNRSALVDLLTGQNVMNSALSIAGVTLLVVLIAIPFAVIQIIFQYRYAFAFTILAEYPEIGVVDALRNSASIMKGNKWRLFCLRFSFIGWYLLAAFCTCGIGLFFLWPYTHAADTAFYDEIANRAAARETEFPSLDPDDYVAQ